jgi:hypothetical protein
MDQLHQLIHKEAVLHTAFELHEEGQTNNYEFEEEAKIVLESYRKTFERDIKKTQKEIYELQKIPNCEMFMKFCVDAIKFFRTGTEEEKTKVKDILI